MALIYTALLLAAAMVAVNANGCSFEPNCTTCSYNNGIGFVPNPFYCNVYYVCYRNLLFGLDNEYAYRWKLMCCYPGLRWDEEHLTCTYGHGCPKNQTCCPDIPTTSELPCPEIAHPTDPTKFLNKVTWQERMCPYGTIWKQEQCTCVVGGDYKKKEPCHKLLSFQFSDTYDSYSCYNFAKGEPYGNPPITNNTLCLNGVDQYLTVSYLNNWFTWNPKAKTFTVCVWIWPTDTIGKRAILSTNCYYDQNSVLEIFLQSMHLEFYVMGQHFSDVNNFIAYEEWTKICVTFNHGVYDIYLNGVLIKTIDVGGDWDVVSHSPATLGFIDTAGFLPFEGYMDDFCFWHQVLTPEEIKKCYDDGPSTP